MAEWDICTVQACIVRVYLTRHVLLLQVSRFEVFGLAFVVS